MDPDRSHLLALDQVQRRSRLRSDSTSPRPSISRRLSVIENAGLITCERRGQFNHYSLVRDNLVNTLNGYIQEVCPVSSALKRESTRLARNKS
jgi:hypothetical protein